MVGGLSSFSAAKWHLNNIRPLLILYCVHLVSVRLEVIRTPFADLRHSRRDCRLTWRDETSGVSDRSLT